MRCLVLWVLCGPGLAGSGLIDQTTSRLGIDEIQAQVGIGVIVSWTQNRVSNNDFLVLARALPNWDRYLGELQSREMRSLSGIHDLAFCFEHLGLDPDWIQEYINAITLFLQARGEMSAILVLQRAIKKG